MGLLTQPRSCYPQSWQSVTCPLSDRVFGLKNFINPPNCSSPNALVLNTNHSWPIYVSPGILLLLYYTATSLLKLRKSRPSDLVSPCHHLRCLLGHW